jgi:hypothetical protein
MHIKNWKELKSAGFIIYIMAIILIVMLFSFYLLKINGPSLYPIQIIERNWIHLLEKYLGKKLIHESLNQFVVRLNKKREMLSLKKDMLFISNEITYHKYGKVKDIKNLATLKKMIKEFNKKLTQNFSINQTR